jgi:hypothetical protein
LRRIVECFDAREGEVMQEILDRSLCGTCKYSLHCAFHRDHRFPVYHCEEFEFKEESLAPVEERDRPAAEASRDAGATEGSATRYRGLCADCENRAGCMFAKPEEGVWHCEEYA